MIRPARALGFLMGALTALAGARVFAPRKADVRGRAMADSGRGRHGTPPGAAALRDGYEPHDASGRSLAAIMLVFAFAAATAVLLMWLLLGVLHRRDASRDVGLTPMQREPVTPPLPHLQADPVAELAALRAREDARLHGYARTDALTARIPIERAMQLLIGQSLDAHAAKEPAR